MTKQTRLRTEEWTECQMYGHDFVNGFCARCPEVDQGRSYPDDLGVDEYEELEEQEDRYERLDSDS
jgi:hypothetical protein